MHEWSINDSKTRDEKGRKEGRKEGRKAGSKEGIQEGRKAIMQASGNE